LSQLLKHAYETVPYYRRIFDQRGIGPASICCAEDLEKLPLLTRQLIKTNSADLMSSGFPPGQLLRLSTGGSTGEPLQFYRSKHDHLDWGLAASQRAMEWSGYKLGDKLAQLTVIRPYHSTLHHVSEIAKQLFQRVHVVDAKTVTLQNLPHHVQALERSKPAFILGYPSSIEMVARHIIKSGRSVLRPAAIMTGAEQLYDYQRELFVSVFGCQVFSVYSAWEAYGIAAECSQHIGFHISAENLIVEIVDNEGRQVPPGREGRVLITNLHNYAMPFIRYEIGDLAVAADTICPCGRGLPMLAKLSGRTTDVVYTRSGKAIAGTALLHVFLTPMGVSQFQFVQESYDRVVIKLVMDQACSKSYLDEVTARLKRQYQSLLENDIDISIEFVDAIPVTRDGKRRVVISRVNPYPLSSSPVKLTSERPE
jgi:phenylacetate-CoA ligase